jgi:hypothetical protein
MLYALCLLLAIGVIGRVPLSLGSALDLFDVQGHTNEKSESPSPRTRNQQTHSNTNTNTADHSNYSNNLLLKLLLCRFFAFRICESWHGFSCNSA